MPLNEDMTSKIRKLPTGKNSPRAKHQAARKRADIYIDSPLMTHRVQFKGELAARIQGQYGTYYTRVRQVGRSAESECSCPSDIRPCKHVVALRATWKENPSSFFELQAVVTELADKTRDYLFAAIVNMAMRAPESLAAVGVTAFADEDVEWQ